MDEPKPSGSPVRAASLVILDRDGVINQDRTDYVKSAAEWVPLPGSIEGMAALSRAGIRVVVATNQSGIGRGLFDGAALADMHEKMIQLVEAQAGEVTGVFFCPHHPDDDCQCRKPRTGLLNAIAEELGVSLQNVPYVGDSLKDIQCALRAGCQPILVRTGNGAATAASAVPELSGVPVFADLQAFAADYLSRIP